MDPGVRAKILVVDDLPEKILAYRAMLEELGQEIVVAHSGDEALKRVLGNQFAVILLDVNMPGLDGLETAALIRQRKRSAHTPIIFVTAFADELRASQAYALGAVDFILAPVVPDVLRAKVKVFVELFRMAEQVRRHADERIALAEERSRREAAEDVNRRLAFLAHAKGVVGQSLDPRVTARDTLRLVVPRLADRALIAQRSEASSSWEATDACTEQGEMVIRDLPNLSDLPTAWLQAIDAVSQNAASGINHAARSPDHEPNTLMLPLRGHDRIFGVFVLSSADSQRPWTESDLTMVEALAARCGIALDNGRLYNEVQEADRQKNEFLSMLAHELRNPLAPIRSAVDVLRLRDGDHPDVGWARDVIDRQVNHLVRLVDDLLDVSRITRGKIRLEKERLTVAEVVAAATETSRPLIEAGNHDLVVSLPDCPLAIFGDRTRLAQVLANLLNNAAKYTPARGTITLEAREEQGEAVLRVRDTGMGIPPEMLGRIFELFTQVDRALDRSQGGLGIGLTLVRQLVEMHGGTVSATSDGPGRGSEFTVRLPLAPAGDHLPPQADSDSAAPVSPLRVLIVDDNADAAETLARFFRHSGHEVQLAYDGQMAIASVGQFAPQAVILDIGLPGINGLMLARHLRSQPAACRIALVAVSGYGQEEFVRKSYDAGFDAYFAKPVDAAALLREVSRLTRAPGAALVGATASQ